MIVRVDRKLIRHMFAKRYCDAGSLSNELGHADIPFLHHSLGTFEVFAETQDVRLDSSALFLFCLLTSPFEKPEAFLSLQLVPIQHVYLRQPAMTRRDSYCVCIAGRYHGDPIMGPSPTL